MFSKIVKPIAILCLMLPTTVEALNLAVPKVRDGKEFRPDGLLHKQTIFTLKEMEFNVGRPANFFDWDETDLDYEDGRHKKIRPSMEVKPE